MTGPWSARWRRRIAALGDGTVALPSVAFSYVIQMGAMLALILPLIVLLVVQAIGVG